MKSNYRHYNNKYPISNTEIVCPSPGIGNQSFLNNSKLEATVLNLDASSSIYKGNNKINSNSSKFKLPKNYIAYSSTMNHIHLVFICCISSVFIQHSVN